MKIIVNSKEITLALDEVPVNSGEYNIRDCEFQFSPEYEGLLKTCVFTKFGVTYKRDIIDSKCQIPYEVLSSEGRVTVGVYGYEIKDQKVVMRYSPKPSSFVIEAGSYVEDNGEGGLDPTEYELLLYIIASSMEEVERDYQKKLTAGNGIVIENNVIGTNLFIPTKTSDIRNDSDFVNSNTQTLRNYGNSIEMLINPSTYVLTCKLKNYDGLVLSSMDIDLPIESMIVDGRYDSQTKELVLTLQSGTVIRISISDIITGLVPESRAIAGLNLEDDITKNELLSALNVIEGAEPNAIESISLNSVPLTPDQHGNINIVIDFSGCVQKSGDTMTGALNFGENKVEIQPTGVIKFNKDTYPVTIEGSNASATANITGNLKVSGPVGNIGTSGGDGSIYTSGGKGSLFVGKMMPTSVLDIPGTTVIQQGGGSFSTGQHTTALGSSIATGLYSFASGEATISSGEASHSEGKGTYAPYGGSLGTITITAIDSTNKTIIISNTSQIKAGNIIQKGTTNYVVIGKDNSGTKLYLTSTTGLAENDTLNFYASYGATGDYSHVEGNQTVANGKYSHAEGYSSVATGGAGAGHAEGQGTTANTNQGPGAHAEGYQTTASHIAAHAEGGTTTASGAFSHAEGQNTTASSTCAHAEGQSTISSDTASHAEGNQTTASSYTSHAEGNQTTASGAHAHAEGYTTTASGPSSHTEGQGTTASSICAHAEGVYTKASSSYQHAQGKYNVEDDQNIYAHIVGNGTSNDARSNAHTLDWSGNAWYAGDVKVGGASYDDPNAKHLATQEYVDNAISASITQAIGGSY